LASFAFADPVGMIAGLAELQRTDAGATCMALDPARSADAIRSVAWGEAIRTGFAMLRQGRSPLGLLRRPGQDWSLHVSVDSASAAGAKAQMDAIRLRMVTAGGVSIGHAVPAALQARPYSIRGALGPVAERWVPVHGLVPLSVAPATMQALLEYAASTQAERQSLDIALGWLISSKPGHILFEPMLLWQDRLGTQHLRHLPERVTARAATRPDNAAARAAVDRMRGDMLAILDSHGAIHMQVGRYYQSAGSPEILAGLKHLFDPARRLNPGSLGL
jgi:D-lactate dehydrogenase (cytochrome)